MPRRRSFWWILVGLLVLNFTISALLSRPAERLSVPYTYFRQQIESGNVKEVTSKGDEIQGTF